jgi:hypothetical protein
MTKFSRRSLALAVLVFSATLASAHGEGGFVVQSVVSGSAAAAAGLEVDDSILRIGGREMKTQGDLNHVLGTHAAGDTVPVVVERGGEELDLELTFGARSDGGPSIGISIAVGGGGGAKGPVVAGPTLTREECVVWAAERYDAESLARQLGPDFEADAKALSACHASDTQGMPDPMPVGWCDNSYKIHCSGLDVLTEIAESQVDSCEELLGESLSSCAAQRVFDRYSQDGELSDRAECVAARDACSAE